MLMCVVLIFIATILHFIHLLQFTHSSVYGHLNFLFGAIIALSLLTIIIIIGIFGLYTIPFCSLKSISNVRLLINISDISKICFIELKFTYNKMYLF